MPQKHRMYCMVKKELLILHKLKSSSDMDYLERIADEELSLRLEAFGAVQINGPKWCGKTTTAEEIAALKGMKDRMVSEPLPWESNGVGYSGYKMNMYDKDGNLLTSWNCGSYYRIIDSQGQFIDINDELREWKKGMEKAHDVSFSIYARTPGENYFAELVNADHGNGIEVYLANGSDDYIRFDLDDEDLYTLQELTDTICVIRKSPLTIKEMDQEYDNLKYTMSVYTNTEASYDFVITDDGSIYIQTKYTFLVGGEGVEEWFRTLEAKYGLDQI